MILTSVSCKIGVVISNTCTAIDDTLPIVTQHQTTHVESSPYNVSLVQFLPYSPGTTIMLRTGPPACAVTEKPSTVMTAFELPNEPILLVTADQKLRDEFVQLLQGFRINLTTCEDIGTAIDIIAQDTFSLILIDEAMPGNGQYTSDVEPPQPMYQLCEMIRGQRGMEETPVLVIMTEQDDQQIERAFAHGATDFLLRPLRSVVVRQRIPYLMHMSQMQSHLRQQEERYRIISNSISDYAYAVRVEPDGTLTQEWITKAVELITGYSADEIQKTGLDSLIHADDRTIVQERYERLLRGQRDVSEYRILTRQGEVRWLRDHGQPTFDLYSGRVNRIYGAAQDITERKRTEAMMQAKTVELEERNQELDAFAHTVAHDLKNPIASMLGFASLVLNYFDRMSEEALREHLVMIMESAYKAKDIINSLLLLASVNKQDDLPYTPLRMHDIINEVLRRHLNMIRDTRAEITMPEDFPVAIGYAPWVEEVWANYLSNALKYGGRPPHVTFGAEPHINGKINFYMIDNGSGLTLEERDKVFMPFTRFSQAKTDGNGLGLSVVHRIVTRLGGEVGVEQVAAGGSKFMFTLPAASSAPVASPTGK
jgi:PAS domain S-box-containing protein